MKYRVLSRTQGYFLDMEAPNPSAALQLFLKEKFPDTTFVVKPTTTAVSISDYIVIALDTTDTPCYYMVKAKIGVSLVAKKEAQKSWLTLAQEKGSVVKKKKYVVPIEWKCRGYVEVEATDENNALTVCSLNSACLKPSADFKVLDDSLCLSKTVCLEEVLQLTSLAENKELDMQPASLLNGVFKAKSTVTRIGGKAAKDKTPVKKSNSSSNSKHRVKS